MSEDGVQKQVVADQSVDVFQPDVAAQSFGRKCSEGRGDGKHQDGRILGFIQVGQFLLDVNFLKFLDVYATFLSFDGCDDAIPVDHPVIAKDSVSLPSSDVGDDSLRCVGHSAVDVGDPFSLPQVYRGQEVEADKPGHRRFDGPVDRTEVHESPHLLDDVFLGHRPHVDIADLGAGIPDHLGFRTASEDGRLRPGGFRERVCRALAGICVIAPCEPQTTLPHIEDHRMRFLACPRDLPVDREASGATCVDEVKSPVVLQEEVSVDVFKRKHQ